MKAALLLIHLLFYVGTLVRADVVVPPIKGDIDSVREPTTPFDCGPVVDGLSIGIWSESNEYRLNHRINVWTSLHTDAPDPNGRSLMADDPLFKDSFLYVTFPDGTVSKVAVGGPIDGPAGGGFSGGVSDHLHQIIRKPGAYKVQWKLGPLKSGVVSFTVVPE